MINTPYRDDAHQIASEVLASDDTSTLTDIRNIAEAAKQAGITPAKRLSAPNTGQQIEHMIADIFDNN